MDNIFDKYNAEWIGFGDNYPDNLTAEYIACNFSVQLKNFKKITLHITGLGLFEASINGSKISDTFFDPGESNFAKRIYYVSYDITDFVNDGDNAIGIILGNGQYTNFMVEQTMEKSGELIEPHRYQKNDGQVFFSGIYGRKKAIALIEGDGEKILSTGEDWFISTGPITFQSWYGGEDYDSTKEIPNWNKTDCDRSNWQKAKIMPPPQGMITKRSFNPIKITEKYAPLKITKNGNSYIIDFGANGAGFPLLKLKTSSDMAGIKIQMLPCEELDDFGFADQRSCTQSWSDTKKCIISDSYVINGSGTESWHPRFCYHGFRYLEVQNMPYEPDMETFTYCRLMADNPPTGEFETDNALLNKINAMTNRSIESNMFSAFTDCPQIEKLGWLETSHLMFKSMAYGWNIFNWIPKIAADMADSSFADGYMPAIVPEFHRIPGLSNDVNWGGACVMTPWYYYEFYRDKRPLEITDAASEAYIKHLYQHTADNLLQNYSQMGDWGQINENTPTILVENCAFYLLLITKAKSLTVLNRQDEAKAYFNMAQDVSEAFHNNSECYNKFTGVYGNGSQSSYGCVLFSGIVKDENKDFALSALVNSIKKSDYHLTSGEVGLKQVFSVLNKYHFDDVIYKMVTNPTPPSYKYFADNSLTCLPEYWNYKEPWWGMVRSRNHAMMGHVKEWLIQGVLGVRYDDIEHITVTPFVPPQTTYARGSFLCGYGTVSVKWRITGENTISITAESPEGINISIVPPRGYVLS